MRTPKGSAGTTDDVRADRLQAETIHATQSAKRRACEVCGDTSGRCRFARTCSCWRGIPCEAPRTPETVA